MSESMVPERTEAARQLAMPRARKVVAVFRAWAREVGIPK